MNYLYMQDNKYLPSGIETIDAKNGGKKHHFY